MVGNTYPDLLSPDDGGKHLATIVHNRTHILQPIAQEDRRSFFVWEHPWESPTHIPAINDRFCSHAFSAPLVDQRVPQRAAHPGSFLAAESPSHTPAINDRSHATAFIRVHSCSFVAARFSMVSSHRTPAGLKEP